MPVSNAQKKATAKYKKQNYDRLELLVPKGKKEIIDNKARELELTRNAYINKLIDKDLEK